MQLYWCGGRGSVGIRSGVFEVALRIISDKTFHIAFGDWYVRVQLPHCECKADNEFFEPLGDQAVPIGTICVLRLDLDAMTLSLILNGRSCAIYSPPNNMPRPCHQSFACYGIGDIFQLLPDLCQSFHSI
jgi:hypothetical protein